MATVSSVASDLVRLIMTRVIKSWIQKIWTLSSVSELRDNHCGWFNGLCLRVDNLYLYF
jgi:hypothetical protein